MSFEAALILAFVIIFVTLVVIISIVATRRQAARDEEMKAAAAARGWQFQTIVEAFATLTAERALATGSVAEANQAPPAPQWRPSSLPDQLSPVISLWPAEASHARA